MFQYLFRALHDAEWHARQFRNIYTVAASGAAWRNAMQKDYAALLVIADGHGIDTQMGQFVSHRCQFVVVCCEECARSCCRVEVLDDGSRYRQAIVGTCSPTNLIQDDQAVSRRVMQDRRRLLHLDHEGAFARRDIILGPDPGKDAVHQSNMRAPCWYEAADLGQQGN